MRLEVSHTVLSPEAQDALCGEILAEIQRGAFKPAGEASRAHWEEVWRNAGPVPPYVKADQVCRLHGQFVQYSSPTAERDWYVGFRFDLMERYFYDVPVVYEFGCGNGWNLAAARESFTEQRFVGLDWSPSAVAKLPEGIEGIQFDFFKPDHGFKLAEDALVWTVGALEQTGRNWEAFLDYLLDQRPALCIHVEPILEWYDWDNRVDVTAIEYHLARNYWQAFPARLRLLSAQGKAEILEQRRAWFGSKYLEGYSLLVWRPT